MAIKRITVVKDCTICNGQEHGCHDCNYKGEVTEEMDFHNFIFEMVEQLQYYKYIPYQNL